MPLFYRPDGEAILDETLYRVLPAYADRYGRPLTDAQCQELGLVEKRFHHGRSTTQSHAVAIWIFLVGVVGENDVLDQVTTGRAFTAEKASGAVPLLDTEQCEIAAGWVLFQNDSNQVVSLASFAKFCASAFGVELAQTTAHDYLHALGF